MFADGKLRMDHVIGGKFKLGRKIGSGSFGELYLGIPPQCFYFNFYRIFFISNVGFPSLSLSKCLFKFVFFLLVLLIFRCQCTNWRGNCCQAGMSFILLDLGMVFGLILFAAV